MFGFGSRTDAEDETSVAAGGINIANLGGDDDLSLPEEEPTTTTTTTTARPRTRPGQRRRPSGVHSVLPGSMVEM